MFLYPATTSVLTVLRLPHAPTPQEKKIVRDRSEVQVHRTTFVSLELSLFLFAFPFVQQYYDYSYCQPAGICDFVPLLWRSVRGVGWVLKLICMYVSSCDILVDLVHQ